MAYVIGFGTFADIESNTSEPNIRPLDGDTRLVRLIDPEQDDGWFFNGVAVYDVGRPVHSDHMPTKARREGAGLKIYPKRDFHQMMGEPILSQAARGLIEEMEPGVHQFFPIEVTIGKDDAPYGTYYKFVLGSRIDTLARDLSGPYNAHGMCKGFGDPDGRVVLDSERIGDHHLWTEKFVARPGWLWASDAMAERLQTSGLTGLKPFRYVAETNSHQAQG